ncbi:MAG: glycosyltransferase family 2 protein [Elusimicrobiota bacterium]
MKSPEVSIVIVNWNGRELLEDCLYSIEENTPDLSYEVCVVDNASDDGSVKMIRERFPRVRLIQNEGNFGFAKACNRGFTECGDTPFVLFLNPDTRVSQGSVARLVECLKTQSDVGASTCALLDGRGRFQSGQGLRLLTLRTAINQYFFLNSLSQSLFPGVFWARLPKGQRDVEWISGAVMMVRRSAVGPAPFFNERYFMYAEDMEASKTLRESGWRLAFLADVFMTHHMKTSTRKSGTRVFASQVVSQAVYIERNLPPWQRPLVKASMAAGYALRWLVYAFLSLWRRSPDDALRRRDHRAYLMTLLRSEVA